MTDLPTPSTTRPVPGQLTMTAPRRGKPPRHLADLDLAGRVEWAKDLGLPGFRAKQLSTHYFTHHTDDPEQMSDLPKAAREELVTAMLPRLLMPVRTISAACLRSLLMGFSPSTWHPARRAWMVGS